MIEYLYKEGTKACENEPLKVKLDGIVCGEIRKVKSGYRYFPKGSKCGGEVYSTVHDVQRSLTED